MEKIPEQPQIKQENFVSVEESKKLAQELLTKYDSEIMLQAHKDINGWNMPFAVEMYQNAIGHYLEEIPEETLGHYWAHGISRGRDLEWLAGALNVLANGGIKGDVGKLNGMFQGFMTQSSFLVILEKDNPFPNGKPEKPDETGLFKVNVGALIVNTKFYPLVDELKSMFPDRIIIKANEIPEYFAENK